MEKGVRGIEREREKKRGMRDYKLPKRDEMNKYVREKYPFKSMTFVWRRKF